ncbi:hypothetical protein AOCH_002420 [Aspergillus ochraceoroseus]|uniref:Cytochrome P450 monooxygenase n=1 Tax=Aspergillus ochraceoroseus TaxID=138278 RepID=A0A0F8V228_9EURO|nr:hypothetical protein AOCH_002420 [Aspergillus ochraceoroseus]
MNRLSTSLSHWSGHAINLDDWDITSQWLVYALLAVGTLFWRWTRSSHKLKVPLVLAEEMRSAKARALEYCYRPRELMWRGYTQYSDQIFGMNTNDGVKLVLPTRFLDELKSHPHLSFKASIDNDMQVEYTRFGGPPEYVINAIKSKMTPSLPLFIPIVHEILQRKLSSEFGLYKDWTSVQVHDRVLKLIGTANARVFHCTKVTEIDEWIDCTTGYVISTFDAIKKLKAWPPYLRPIIFRAFLPERKLIQDQWYGARRYIADSIREKQARQGGPLEDPPSMFDHLTSGKNEHLATNLDEQVLYQMTLVAVGTVTTFASVTQCLYDLAAYPEYIPMLREEMEQAPRDPQGHFSKESLASMMKLDSFIKESQRISAPDLSTFQRAATADLTLSDGTFIPKGTKIECATSSIHMDPVHYENPNQFDGLRYYRARQVSGEENKHMYVSVGKHDLSFGYGRHACPGRFLGHVNIKLLMAEIILHYDIKNLPGQTRPKNDEFEAIVSPDPVHAILMKSRH